MSHSVGIGHGVPPWAVGRDVVLPVVSLSISPQTLTPSTNDALVTAATFTLSPLALTSTPQKPTGLQVTAGDGQNTLSWADNSANEDGFKVYRSTTQGFTPGAANQIDTAAADTTSYTDTGAVNGTTYYYRVAATNAAGDSALSNEASGTPQAASTSLAAIEGVPAPADWTAQGTALTPDAGAWDARFPHGTPGPILEKDGTYYLYFIGADGDRSSDGGPAHRGVGVATASSPGGPWTKHASNPVIPYSEIQQNGDEEEGAWRLTGVVQSDGTVVLYVSHLVGSGGGVSSDIHCHTSPDGVAFTDAGIVLDAVADDGEWYGNGDEFGPMSAYVEDDGTIHVWYTAKAENAFWDWGHMTLKPEATRLTNEASLDASYLAGHGSDMFDLSETERVIFAGDNANGDVFAYRMTDPDFNDFTSQVAQYTTLADDQFAVYLDRGSDQWHLYGAVGPQGDATGVDHWTAPVAYVHTGEPATAVRIFEHDFASVPVAGSGWVDASHAGIINVSSDSGHEVISDPSAVKSPDGVLDFEYPLGLGDGAGGFWLTNMWDESRDPGPIGINLEEMYVHAWINIVGDGTDWHTQGTGSKIPFYFAQGSTIRRNHSPIITQGGGGNVTQIELTWFIYEMEDDGSDAGGGSVRHSPNVLTKPLQVGSWHEVAFYGKMNTRDSDPGQNDGIARWWVGDAGGGNLELVGEYTNIRWGSATNSYGFYNVRFDPIWGGDAGETKNQEDHWYCDHVYVSGIENLDPVSSQ